MKPLLFFILLTLLVQPRTASAHDDHGHEPEAAALPPVANALPRFAASSEHFELVGVLNGRQLLLYVDDVESNAPVKGAALDIEFGGRKLALKPQGEGAFEATLAQDAPSGVTTVKANIRSGSGSGSEQLQGELDLHADTHADAPHGSHGREIAAGAAAGLLAIAALAFILRRRNTQRGSVA